MKTSRSSQTKNTPRSSREPAAAKKLTVRRVRGGVVVKTGISAGDSSLGDKHGAP